MPVYFFPLEQTCLYTTLDLMCILCIHCFIEVINESMFFLAQVVRSVGQWSAGTTQIEGSIHNAYFSLIEKAEHFVYIEVCAFSLTF
jgi:phosphatidylserine/phosphatidylglycerophosphate/cardiolipin synthase-like enzyme